MFITLEMGNEPEKQVRLSVCFFIVQNKRLELKNVMSLLSDKLQDGCDDMEQGCTVGILDC